MTSSRVLKALLAPAAVAAAFGAPLLGASPASAATCVPDPYNGVCVAPVNATVKTTVSKLAVQKTPKTGHDKTAVMFRVPHNPGALVDALDVFKQNRINLTWIESFPSKVAKSEYIFFVDFEGHAEDPKVSRALKSLAEHCQDVTVLGSFPIAAPSA